MIPSPFVQELLARVDIVEVVGRSVQLKKAGANYLGRCPFHSEKSPSFTVSPTKQFYHCFGCGAHGTAISFLIEHSGLGFVDAVKDLAQTVGMQVPQDDGARSAPRTSGEVDLAELLGSITRFYKSRLKESEQAIQYLKNRGLTGETAARFAIGYAPEQWRALEAAVPDYQHESLLITGMVIDSGGPAADGSLADVRTAVSPADDPKAADHPATAEVRHDPGSEPGRSSRDGSLPVGQPAAPPRRRFDRFRHRIMFPIRNPRGQVIGFGGRVLDKSEPKYMNSPETPLFSKGRELYGLYEARESLRRTDCAIVVEGYMDVVMLAQHGVDNAVATLGTATTPDHVQKLLRLVDRVVFAFDGDAAGRKAAWRALEACLPKVSDTKRIDFLFLPSEHDPDSYVREFGRDGFERLLESAQSLSEFLILELTRRSDNETAEGRAQILAAGRPLLLAMPPVALRLQLIHRLAEVGRVSTAELQEFLRQGAELVRPAQGTARPSSQRPGRNPDDKPYSQAEAATQRQPRTPIRSSRRNMTLEARIRVLTALHPALVRDEIDPAFLDAQLLSWFERLARLPAGSTFAGLTEALAAENDDLARQIIAEVEAAPAMSDWGIEEARLDFDAALRRLREKGLDREKQALAAGGLTSREARERYQFLQTVKLDA